MSTIGVVIAGGQSERMRASGISVPKPLVRVGGVTLLERNLFALLRAGVPNVWVSTSSHSRDVAAFAARVGRPLLEAGGGSLSILEERRPLGNIGSAGELAGLADRVLVVYPDNLTTLNLRRVLSHHSRTSPAMTLAVHEERLRLPYGEVVIEDGEVASYTEKPERRSLVSSGIAVLAPEALSTLPHDRSTGLVDLFSELRRRGQKVAAHRHHAPWVDVNDSVALARAEAVVRAHATEFELWLRHPREQFTHVFVHSAERILLRRCATRPTVTWTFPLTIAGAFPEADLIRKIKRALNRLGVKATDPRPPLVFDDLEVDSQTLGRHYVLGFSTASVPRRTLPTGLRWLAKDRARRLDSLGSGIGRALT